MLPEDSIKLIRHPALSNTIVMDWADLGCGSGLFTNALADVLFPGSTIYAVDKNLGAFQKRSLPVNTRVIELKADFTRDDLSFENLDGILMANSLHFVRDKALLIKRLNTYLKAPGCFLIIEYDTDIPNPWVPYPVSFQLLKILFVDSGYGSVDKIQAMPSKYNRADIYSALVKR